MCPSRGVLAPGWLAQPPIAPPSLTGSHRTHNSRRQWPAVSQAWHKLPVYTVERWSLGLAALWPKLIPGPWTRSFPAKLDTGSVSEDHTARLRSCGPLKTWRTSRPSSEVCFRHLWALTIKSGLRQRYEIGYLQCTMYDLTFVMVVLPKVS